MIFATLPQTATRERTNSDWAFMALPFTGEGGAACFSVTVLEFRGVKKTRRVVDRYTMEPTAPEVGPAGIAYWFCKTHHSGDEDTVRGRQSAARVGEAYQCEVGPGYHRCSCTGGATEGHRPGGACLHVLILTDMVEQGDLSPTAPHPLDRQANTGEDASPGAGESAEVDDDWLTDPRYTSTHVW